MKVIMKSHKSPPAKITEKICQEMQSPDFPNRNIGLGKEKIPLLAEEKLKYEICQTIAAHYKRENNLTNRRIIGK